DRQADGKPVDLVVAERGAARGGATPAGARRLESPSRKGLVLMRVLAAGPQADRAQAEAARRTLACTTLPR
ncbi:MAG: hypothetical protein HY906_08405, partial [Deltaproteobacteria bacterium]|nr:hypothetical protein [Deltaproteobacteria bacterium]